MEWKPERRRFESLCDPGIAHAFRNPWQYSVDLWKYWDSIDIPVFGGAGTSYPICFLKMSFPTCCEEIATQRAATVQNCGHAPALIAPDQIELVEAFLNKANDAGR